MPLFDTSIIIIIIAAIHVLGDSIVSVMWFLSTDYSLPHIHWSRARLILLRPLSKMDASHAIPKPTCRRRRTGSAGPAVRTTAHAAGALMFSRHPPPSLGHCTCCSAGRSVQWDCSPVPSLSQVPPRKKESAGLLVTLVSLQNGNIKELSGNLPVI